MPHDQPRQPLAAFFQGSSCANFTDKPVKHYLVDMPTPTVPYSTNRFLLAELASEAAQRPEPGLDIVIFHSVGKIVLLGLVTAVLNVESNPDQPGHCRTLVSCEPMSTIADVNVPEGQDGYLRDELVVIQTALEKNLCPPTSKGKVPKGAPMQDQKMACQFVLDTLVDAALP